MKKRIISVAISLVLILTMFAAGVGNMSFYVSAEGADGKVLADELVGYRRITVADINASSGYRIMNQDADDDDNLLTVSGAWDLAYVGSFGGKTYLDVDMNFNNSEKGKFALSWQGNEKYKNSFYLYMVSSTTFRLLHYDDNSVATPLCDANADFGFSPTAWFNVKLLTNVEKASVSSATETVTWQCWVNNMYAGGGSFEEAAHDRKVFTTKSSNENFLTMRVPKILEEELAGYDKISISDFKTSGGNTVSIPATPTGMEIDDGNKIIFRAYNQNASINSVSPEAADTYSLDKKYFDFDINQNGSTSDLSAIYLYERVHWYDDLVIYWDDVNHLKIDYRKTNEQGSHYVESTFTYDLRAFGRATNTEFFNIKIRSDFSQNSSDSSKRDAVIQIWINNCFADELNLEATDMRNGLVIRRQGTTNWLLRESKDINEELAGYRRVDMFDYSKTVSAEGVVSFASNGNATSYITDFDKTYLDVDVNFESTTTQLQYQGLAKTRCCFFMYFPNAEKFRLSAYRKYNEASQLPNANSLTVQTADYGISPGSYFNIKVRTDITATSATVDSVLVQLWINDVYAGEMTVSFTYESASTHTKSYIWTTGNVDVRSATDIETQTDGYKRIVGDDFDTIGASISYDGSTYISALAGEYTGNTSDISRSYIDVDVKIPNGINPFMTWPSKNKTKTAFGGDGEQVRFYLSDTTLMMKKHSGGTSVGTDITLGDISAAPYNYSASEFTNIKIKTTVYGADSIVLAVWINDNFLKNVYINTYDAETIADMTCLGFRGTSDANITVRTPLDNANLSNLEYNLAYGNYLLKGWPTFRVNGTAMSSGEVLSAPGDYTVEYLIDGEPVASRTVSLYKLGDANLDGSAFVAGDSVYKDAQTTVGMIKYGAVTRAAVLAADLNNDGMLNDADSALFMAIKSDVSKADTVIGVNYGDSLGFNYENGKNVMPIGGYYGPASATEITDAMYQLIKDSGINMITFLPTKWGAGSNSNRNFLRNLALAQKYGIGVYVSDRSTNALTVDDDGNVIGQNTVSTASELADAMAQYGIYDSVIGIEVVDEPKPSIGGDPSADYYSLPDYYLRYKYYNDLLGTLKTYSNVSGGYVLQGAGAYSPGDYTILDEVESDVDYLSFDSYLYLEKDDEIKGYKRNGYFETLDTMREKSLESSKPFWSYVSAGSDFRDGGDKSATRYYSTEADVLWNVNTSLAFGAKGIVYFPMIQPLYFSYDDSTETGGHDYDRNGIIGADGNANRYYTMVQRANTQISAVDDVLMNADSKGVITLGKATTDINYAASQRDYTFKGIVKKTGGKYTDKLTNVTASKSAGAMVGAFDYHSSEAYYVVNYDTTEGAAQTITLTFGNTQDVTVIRDGVETTYSSVSSLSLNLDSGEGALVILEDYHDVVIDAADASFTLSEAATVNDVARPAAYEIKKCGVYTVQYISGVTYNVVIYKVGDITADSSIDVRDLVRLKKYITGIDTVNKSGLNAYQALPSDKYNVLLNMLLG